MASEPEAPRPTPEGPAAPATVTAPLPATTPPRRSRRRKALTYAAVLLAAYLAFAYAVMPLWWTRYAHRHPSLEDIPNITYTGDGHPGDPINVSLIGTKTQTHQAVDSVTVDLATSKITHETPPFTHPANGEEQHAVHTPKGR